MTKAKGKKNKKKKGFSTTTRKLLSRTLLFFFSLSILSVLLLKWCPVRYTPLMFQRFVENIDRDSYRNIREWIPLNEISDEMIRAVVAAEDVRFTEHCGFDWDAIQKAMDLNKRYGSNKYGASTISQQTAKNVYLLPARSWIRKGLEVYFTFLIETFWSKRRIMEVYLNIIEVGDGLYGVEAAAKTYFNKPASELNVYEASQIASILPNPAIYKISSPSRYLKERQSKIRRSMERIKKDVVR